MLSSCAKVGRYAFIATTLAPNPTFANMARSADKGHIGDVEGRRRNSIAHVDPKPAKRRRVTLRFGATSEVFAEQGEGYKRDGAYGGSQSHP